MIQNVVIGNPLVHPKELFAYDDNDWTNNELPNTLFTNKRFLPAVMKEAGVVSSISEVKRNRPDLIKMLKEVDFLKIKWGKKILHIAVGESE